MYPRALIFVLQNTHILLGSQNNINIIIYQNTSDRYFISENYQNKLYCIKCNQYRKKLLFYKISAYNSILLLI